MRDYISKQILLNDIREYINSEHVHEAVRAAFQIIEEKIVNGFYSPTGWISVKEQLPKANQKVYVRFYNDAIVEAEYIAPRTVKIGEFAFAEDEYDFDYDVLNDVYWVPRGFYEYDSTLGTNWRLYDDGITHWKPLSPAPRK